jgi:homocysteine S-methyltransferase
LILAECAIAERLRRMPGITLHPTLFNTPFIHGPPEAKRAMSSIYQEYLQTAGNARLPLLLTAPTWRLDASRVAAAGLPETINADAVAYLIGLRDGFGPSSPVLVGALTGPRNDCYRPDLAPGPAEAETFHNDQISALATTAADFLLAQTLPAVGEALGIARAMSATDKHYLISFCTGTDGRVLDGTPLAEAMDYLDAELSRPPVGYMVNCTHPRFLLDTCHSDTLTRLVGIQANGSSKDVTKLDGACATEADPIENWTRSMFEIHSRHGVIILGGCCGTTLAHMKSLVTHASTSIP